MPLLMLRFDEEESAQTMEVELIVSLQESPDQVTAHC